MFKCKFDFTHNNCWLIDVSRKFPRHEFLDNAAYVKPNNDLMDICFVKGDAKEFSGILQFLRRHKTVISVQTIDRGGDYLYLEIVGKRGALDFITPILPKHNCFRIGDLVGKNGRETWTVGAPRKADINSLLKELESHGQILGKRTTKTPFEVVKLTERQKKALKLAYDKGIYDIPRGVKLGELAVEMGIEKAAYREHLKRAEAKVIKEYLET